MKLASKRKERRENNLDSSLEYERDYRERNRARTNELMTVRRSKLKRKCLYFLGGPLCPCCGFSSEIPSQFDFHHKDPSKKDHSIGNMISNNWKFEDIEKELRKCLILCRNCHSAFHSEIVEAEEIKSKIKKLEV